MKRVIILLLLALAACCPKPLDESSVAAGALARRVIGPKANRFEFRTISSPKDSFRVYSQGRKIVIEGNNANSMAVGLNHYLRFVCNVNMGWNLGEKPAMPHRFPKVEEPIEVGARAEQRFFLNYCTFGYTMPWWHWEEWEYFIDWMALNGVNMPLAITGQESIWYKVWTEMGLSPDEVRAYFTGPAHLPWHRMLNIDSWGGPLPESWLEGQEALQKQIVTRERELCMRPVLPAFSGHVPAALGKVYPDAKIGKMGAWCDFPSEYVPSFLDPMDSLFPVIQAKYLQKQADIYGTDHIYGIDLFNEMKPLSSDPDYIARVGSQVYQSLQAADPEGVWLQMTWLFWNERDFWTTERIKPFITSYPADKSILLDYYCDGLEIWRRTESFFGVPYIWCYLGNFGGNTFLMGNIKTVNERIERAFEQGGSNMLGLGCTLEGFDGNPFMYQFVLDKAWDFPEHKDIDRYTQMLSDSRAGVVSPEARDAWKTLVNSIYSNRIVNSHREVMVLRPKLKGTGNYHAREGFAAETDSLEAVVRGLLAAKGRGPAYEFDVVNITREWLSHRFEIIYGEYLAAYQENDAAAVSAVRTRLESLFDSMDALLATNPCFLLGKWIDDARKWGATPAEADYFESNARDLLTSWGDGGNLLTDYAARNWNGLTGGFYKSRWEILFCAVDAALASGTPVPEDELRGKMIEFEKAWWNERIGVYPSTPHGDPVAEAAKVLEKFAE